MGSITSVARDQTPLFEQRRLDPCCSSIGALQPTLGAVPVGGFLEAVHGVDPRCGWHHPADRYMYQATSRTRRGANAERATAARRLAARAAAAPVPSDSAS